MNNWSVRQAGGLAPSAYPTSSNPDLQRAERELAELQGASFEYLRLAREVKYHESLYDFLSRQLEAARIDEAKNTVLVQVVDHAVVPEKKSSPRRLLIVALAALLSFLLVSFYVIVRETIRRRRHDPYEAARLDRLNQYLRGPLR